MLRAMGHKLKNVAVMVAMAPLLVGCITDTRYRDADARDGGEEYEEYTETPATSFYQNAFYFFSAWFKQTWTAAVLEDRLISQRAEELLGGVTSGETVQLCDGECRPGDTYDAAGLAAEIERLFLALEEDLNDALSDDQLNFYETQVIRDSQDRLYEALNAAAELLARSGTLYEGQTLSEPEWRDTFWSYSS